MTSRSIDIPRRASNSNSNASFNGNTSGSVASSAASSNSMATASSSLDVQRGAPARPVSSFPAARLGTNSQLLPTGASSTDVPSSSMATARQGGVQLHHQFGSVPASSTAILYPGLVNASPARSHLSASVVPGTSPATSGVTGSADYDSEFVRTIGRHLVSPKPASPSPFSKINAEDAKSDKSHSRSASVHSPTGKIQGENAVDGDVDPNFYSLSLQGGDITRQLYNWQREHEQNSDVNSARRGRSRSFSAMPRPEPEDDTLNIHNINIPGGFRRNYLLSKAKQQQQYMHYGTSGDGDSDGNAGEGSTAYDNTAEVVSAPPRPFLTRNFLEFLSVYGHFAGEELEDDDDYEDDEEMEEDYDGLSTVRSIGDEGLTHRLRRHLSRSSRGSDNYDEYENASLHSIDEEAALLTGKKTVAGAGGRHHGQIVQDTSATKAVLLLLKGFVGTGVLFLPKAYYNGGMLFSSAILFFLAVLTYYCFVLLIDSRMRVQASFGDMGGILYGKKMRLLILTSIVLSQVGFAAAYTVFTSENLQAFILAITDCQVFVPVRYLIFLQMIVFVPLSMVRNISKLSVSALIADFFILLGLAYVYFWDGRVLIEHGVSDVAAFNPRDWTLFIGTAIFTFEGIGLVIPIHESMKRPNQFYSAIGLVMAIITLVYIAMGVMSYAAYGSNVETVVILNMPQDNRLVNSVQFIYAMAILLSTPLQLFPAIRIMENAWFVKSGKHDLRAKWQKNIFRTAVVLVTAFVAWGGADDLDKFVALIGSLACIPLTYIYPPLLHYRACATSMFNKGMDIFICVFGLGCMIYTTTNTIESWATSTPDNDFFRYCS
ncbi:transmembrane amino acid transporter protein-domain-containing protein [Lipomyces tetrasporus]|uniref:Transmembrane amino acid transporter protein-domain-containing protein n=1 Tax=Lipomyces tetrasporus TaxID=54092 RepID=A0AAD7VRT9_9ASCO|nr:transmembrane amino acid transporter protein-domain-containing protein [Lipomyces tetrasporus]KAJ8099266.1 transmembrane amino acid transporter protein-domain-containing protein [Lipomyces tetrasporus]